MSAPAKRNRPQWVVRQNGWVARPKSKQCRQAGKNKEWYCTARYRTEGVNKERSLGWHSTQRSMKKALVDFVLGEGLRPGKHSSKSILAMVEPFVTATHKTKLDSKRGQELRPSSKWNRRYNIQVVFMPWVKEHHPNMTCNDFGKDEYSAYRQYLESKHSRFGRPYSPNTINGHLSALHAYLEYLVDRGVRTIPVPSAPMVSSQRLPARRVCDQELCLIAEGLAKLDPRGPHLLSFLRATGCRPSEALNICRGSLIHMVEGGKKIPAVAIEEVKSHGFRPKTSSSYRRLPIDEVLWQKLKEIAPDDGSPIFGSPNKNDFHYWRGRIMKITKALGLPTLKFSDFRKHRASQLIDAGCSKAAYSQLMGHSPVVALRHYAMATDSELQQAAQLVPAPMYFSEQDHEADE